MSNRLGRFESKTEREFFARRRKILSDPTVTAEVVADNPFLFMTRQEASDMLARLRLFDLISDVPGYIVECGVNRGNHTLLMALLSTVTEPFALNRKIYGFDTFQGFRSLSAVDGEVTEVDFQDESGLDLLMRSVDIFDANRPQRHFNKIELIEGDAVETIPKWVATHPEAQIALLYLDFDLYLPTLVALRELSPLVPVGGVVAFDEFCYDRFAGETQAFREVLKEGWRLRKFNFHPFVAYAVRTAVDSPTLS